MNNSSNSLTKANNTAWTWLLFNIALLAVVMAADFGGMRAARTAQTTFHALAFVTKMWLLGLFVAACWLVALMAFCRVLAMAPRWMFILLSLLLGLLLLGTFPPLMQHLWGLPLLTPIWRFELHAGPSNFTGLTLDLLFLLNVWGLFESAQR